MNLPESIKAFTFRFLKIVINSKGIRLKNEQSKDKNKNIGNNVILLLLKAYLIFIIIHELNHFMKRYLNQNKAYDLCKTPTVNEHNEGGELLIELIFGHILIHNTLNVEQANYILKTENWNKKSVMEFRTDFLKIRNDYENNGCIVYLNSENTSICDHSKLNG